MSSFKTDYYANFLSLIHSSSTVLTPNRRLSAALNHAYCEQQITNEKKVWPQMEILPITSWFIKLWNEYANKTVSEEHLLLTPIQESYLWESIITKSDKSELLLQVSETAEMVKSAYGLLKQWRIFPASPTIKPRDDGFSESIALLFRSSPDYLALQEWISEFEALRKKNHWIDAASLPEIICELIDSNQITSKKNIFLFGFNEESPQLQHLITQCRKKEIHFHSAGQSRDGNSIKAFCQRFHFKSEDEELLSMARYAKQRLNEDPSISIACVIPTLDQIRDRVVRIFDQIFQSENQKYNISAGKPLIQYPIIRMALQLLSLHQPEIKIESFSTILASPFLAYADKERIKRARFDVGLRKQNINTIHLANTIADPNSTLLTHCPKLGKALIAFYNYLSQCDGYHSHADWANIFTELLTHLGWPGERSLNSHEYQVVENWQKILFEFTQLDHVATSVKINQAYSSLTKIVSKTIFQPQSPEAPIQILGVLEAAHQAHDEIWIAGMNDISWPERPKPHPFIPKQLQREMNMPHASSEREYEYCKQLIDIFKTSSKKIIFSYADIEDDLVIEASPLIRDIPECHINELALTTYQSPSQFIFETRIIEQITDHTAPTCQPDEKFRGGIRSIQQQALCPFKAFAECRLSAMDIDDLAPGLRAIDRGNLTHKAIELLGIQIKDYHYLQSLTDDQLNDIITNCIDETFTQSSLTQAYKNRYMNLEKKRLHQLLNNWLVIEKQRPPFKILATETETQIQLNQLSLTVRIDRIDELEDGKKLIIDYKTGKRNEISHWFDTHPEEVQLPLYSLIDPDNTIGIAFAQLMPSALTYKGVSQNSIGIEGIKPISDISKALNSWEEQINSWQTIFTQLSDDFYNGKAHVQPKSKQVCNWCDLKSLCRINEEQV